MQWTPGTQYVVSRGVCVAAGNTVEVAMENGTQGTGNAGILINGMQIYQADAGPCTQPGSFDGGTRDGGAADGG